VSSEFFGRGDINLGISTTILLMLPVIAKLLLQILKAIESLVRRKPSLAKIQLLLIPRVLFLQSPIR
jgi:hypothetical protein